MSSNRGPGAAALALLALFGVACASPTPAPQPPYVYEDYRVGAPDGLVVTVLPEPAITQTAVVRPDGKITIQLIGDVQASGRTPEEIATEIEEKIARYKRGARATVAVTNASSSTVTILGEVRRPGAFPIPKHTRIAEALGNAGGLTNFASLDNIHIVRPNAGGAEIIWVDMNALRGGDMTTNVQIEAGDFVYVPPNVLAKIGYAFQAVLFPLQPLLGLANSVAGSAIAGN
ncbi:MAG: polysaccharide biosynthesis/export family protein [Myxococcota bacterium]